MKRSEAKAQGLKTYDECKPCPRGHDVGRRVDNGSCIECSKTVSGAYKAANKPQLKEKRKTYVAKNRDKIVATEKIWRVVNSAALSGKRRVRRIENIDTYLLKERAYNEQNRAKIRESRRQYYREYMSKKRQDPTFNMKFRMRGMIRRIVEKTGMRKLSSTEQLMGYTGSDLRDHIESGWCEGMNWGNYGEWHIDHIKSIQSYVDAGVTDPSIINALSNLQPLWAFDNLSKGA